MVEYSLLFCRRRMLNKVLLDYQEIVIEPSHRVNNILLLLCSASQSVRLGKLELKD
jgi:hypothetical protein